MIRPVARKHDAEESTPWEVIKEARKWGLQGLEHMQRMGADPDGQFGVISAEELHWGCAGIALAISGSGLAAAGHRRVRDPRADRRVGARSASGPTTRSSSAPTPSPSRRPAPT